jgi:hypothetical protein
MVQYTSPNGSSAAAVNSYPLLHSGNYNSYAPTLTGGGASGTWGINITGSAGSAPGYLPLSGGTLTGNLVLATGANRYVEIGSATSYYYRLQSTNDNFEIREVTTPRLTISYPTGAVTASTDFRAPIFYDSNDTTYYVNPNGGSNLYNLTVGNYSQNQAYPGIIITGNTAYNYNFLNGTWASSITAGILANCLNQWEFAIHDSGERVVSPFIFFGGGTNYILMGRDIGWGTTYIEAASSFRAPIFYDSNNTAYYTDQASTSNYNRLNLVGFDSSGRNYSREWIEFPNASGLYSPINGAHFYPNNASSYGSWNLQGSRNGWAGIYFSSGGNTAHYMLESGNGGLYFESGGRWANYYSYSNNCTGFGTSATSSAYNIYCPTGIYSGGRVDGTIFYDSNNTGYYCDPNGTSNFVGLTVANVISGSVSGRSMYVAPYAVGSSSAYTGRSAPYGGAYTYVGYSDPNTPTTYTAAVGFGNGSGGSGEIIVNWVDGTASGLWFRTLRDCCSNWTGWTRIANYYYAAFGTDITSTGNITAYSSDRRLKTNITPIESPLEKLEKIGGYTFDWDVEKCESLNFKPSNVHEHGVIAQEIQAIMPDAVTRAPFDLDENGNPISDQEYLTVRYDRIVPLLIEAIKEQSKQIKNLQRDLVELRGGAACD